MGKKYSVQVEDGRLVSVEVDGATYRDPEEITNAVDREKVKALVERTLADDEGGLEQEFHQELQAMQNQPRWFPKIFVIVFLGVGLICLAIAAVSGYNAMQQISREVSAPGQVVDTVTHTSRDSETGQLTDYSYPVVQFSVPGRPPLTVQMSEGSSPPHYAAGDPVTVLYDPARPRSARIKSVASDVLLWLLPGVTFLVGAIFAGVALIFLRLWSPWRKPADPFDPFQR